MDNERDLRTELRSALDAVLPPVPWLEAAVRQELRKELPKRRQPNRIALRLPRNSQKVAAALLLVVLAVAAVAGFLAVRQILTRSVPAGSGSTIAPEKMVSPTIGWASGPGHAVLRTTDGGVHWTEMHPIPSPGFEASSFFLDATHAWITDTKAAGAGDSAYQFRTFRTADGGQTWQQGIAVEAQSQISDGLGPDLFFVDPSHGWLLLDGANAIYKSSDGGLHWQLASSSPARTPECLNAQMSFATTSAGWLVTICQGGPNLWVTHDGGVTWQVQTLPVKISDIGELDVPVFFDPMHGELLVGVGVSHPTELLLVTSDGGGTWSTRSLPAGDQMKIDFVDASHGWAITGHESELSNGSGVWDSLELYNTDDGGLSWAPMQTNLVLQAPEGLVTQLLFVDQKNGFAVRAPSCFGSQLCTQGPSEFLKTTDGGHTWMIVWRA